jgi:hypothetical protein
MVQARCPQCGSLVEGIPGVETVCGQCGFRSALPAPPPPSAPPAAAPVRSAATPAAAAAPTISVWAYVLGLVSPATFFLAGYGLPFALGAAAIVMALVARRRDPTDRRPLVAIVAGALGLVAGLVWLLL